MKKFKQIFSDEHRNEYGLQCRAAKPIKNLLKNIQNFIEARSIENPKTVEIYIKSSQNKSFKTKLSKITKIEQLKQIIQQKFSIPFQNQLIYLNGKQISIFSSIILNQKQIIHIIHRKSIVGLDQHLLINLKLLAPKYFDFDGKFYEFSLSGGDKINILKNLLLGHEDFRDFDQKFQFNFMQSGRMINKQDSFTQNLIPKNCDMICLLSENQVETKFSNQCQQKTDPQEKITSQIFNTQQKNFEPNHKLNQEQTYYDGLEFNRPRASSNKFLISNGKSTIYSKNLKTARDPSNKRLRSNQDIIQIDSKVSLPGSGFKKKKNYPEHYESDDSHLIKKIVVNKSRQEIQKIAQNSLIKQQFDEVEDQKKSVVSSSSSGEDQKNFIPIRQQKQYRPCPSIPQRNMTSSQKIKINMELRKLFGNPSNQKVKVNIFRSNQDDNDDQSAVQVPIETMRSRVIIQNSSMKNTIEGKTQILRFAKNRKLSNRYGQENIQEGD